MNDEIQTPADDQSRRIKIAQYYAEMAKNVDEMLKVWDNLRRASELYNSQLKSRGKLPPEATSDDHVTPDEPEESDD